MFHSKLKPLLWVMSFALILVAAWHVRLYPLRMNVSASTQDKAALLVVTKIKSDIRHHVNQSHAHLNPQEREAVVQKKFDETIRRDAAEVKHNIDELNASMSGAQSISDPVYLLGSDSYYFLWLTNNVIQTGQVADKKEGSRFFARAMAAPVGQWEPYTFHPHIGSWVWRVMKAFYPDVPVSRAAAYTPLVLVAWCLLAFFIACRLMGCSVLATSLSAMMLMMAAIFVKRSTFAWYDSDPYNVLFPIICAACFFRAVLATSSWQRWIAVGALGVVSVMYSLFWQGWIFTPAVLGVGLAGIAFYNAVVRRTWTGVKEKGWMILILISTILLGLIGLYGWQQIMFLVNEAVDGVRLLVSAEKISLWPDLFVAVGELHPSDWDYIVEYAGGPLFLMGVLGSVVVAGLRLLSRRQNPMNDLLIVLLVWASIALVMTFSAQRFALLLIVPCAFLFAWGFDALIRWLKSRSPSSWPRWMMPLIMTAIVVGAGGWTWFQGHHKVSTLLNPIFNDTWHRALTKINNDTPQDAIVNSWWPPGHFVKAVAQRRVIFDGASIKSPEAYWLTNALLASTEAEALGILRMLNTSSVKATEFLHDELGWPLSKVAPFLKTILTMTPSQALVWASSQMEIDEAQLLIRMTHASPPPVYVMIYNEMMQEPGIWAMFHKWDFKKIEAIQDDPELARRAPSKKSDDYKDFFWKLVGGMYRASPPLKLLQQRSDAWIFEEGLIINPDTKQALMSSTQFGRGIPYSVFYLKDGEVQERVMPKATLGYSIVLFQKPDGSYQAMLMDHVLAGSLLVRLYLFNGAGLSHFTLFDDQHDLSQRTVIKTFEVQW